MCCTRDRDGRRPHWVGVYRKLELELDGGIRPCADVPGGNEVLFIGLLLVRQEPVGPHSDLSVAIHRGIGYLDSPLAFTNSIGRVLEWGRTGSLSDQSPIADSSAVTSPPGANYWKYASHYLARLTITVPD